MDRPPCRSHLSKVQEVKYRLALFGAAPDTPNMGVSALFASAVEGLTRELGQVEWVIFDNGLGIRESTFKKSDGTEMPLTHYGARVGRRYHRPENLSTMQLAARCGGLGGLLNKGVHLIDSCDAVLDVSGGDSFSDIYGWGRFRAVYWPKRLAGLRRKPLILLPQTYGPYRGAKAFGLARSVTASANLAWARDPNSFQVLKSLVGEGFNPSVHRQGVDMAFGLQPRSAAHRLPEPLKSWLSVERRNASVVGINISGLIYNDPGRAISNYHFIADYCAIAKALVQKILATSDARIVLVPHVMDIPGHYESDLEACNHVAQTLSHLSGDRVVVSPIDLDQSEVKWLISRLDWFCGTRMHATIAALSTGVPSAAIAYSDKTLGVFATCGQASQVFDPRSLDTRAMIDGLVGSFETRDRVRRSLEQSLPTVTALAKEQMRAIADRIRAKAADVKA